MNLIAKNQAENYTLQLFWDNSRFLIDANKKQKKKTKKKNPKKQKTTKKTKQNKLTNKKTKGEIKTKRIPR